MSFKPLPSIETLREFFKYEELTGHVICIKRSGSKSKLNQPIGNLNCYGYYVTCFAGQKYFVHRIAWALIYGKDPGSFEVDHINGNTTDNKKENLRLATHGQNMHNSKKHKDNTSGYKGVYWNKQSKAWMAYTRIDGKMLNLGNYFRIEDAVAAVKQTRKQLHGQFTNHG